MGGVTIKQAAPGGSIVLCGHGLDQLVAQYLLSDAERDTFCPPLQLTLLSSDEARTISLEELQIVFKTETTKILPVRIKSSERLDLVFIWAAGHQLRKRLGLKFKHFLIFPPNATWSNKMEELTSLLLNHLLDMHTDTLDHLAFSFHLFGQYDDALLVGTQLCKSSSESYRGFLRVADAAFQLTLYKLAMLSYGRASELGDNEKLEQYCLKRLMECSSETEWGYIFREFERKQVPLDIRDALLTPWSLRLTTAISDLTHSSTLSIESREPLFIPSRTAGSFYKLPRFFRWLVPYYLAVMSTPKNGDDIRALASMGIRHVLTLTEEEPLSPVIFKGTPVMNTFMPVTNERPPSIEQMDIFLRLLENEDNLPLLIHCGGGKGRAGTLAACYLVAFGFRRGKYGKTHPEMSAKEAISSLRQLRPGSLETNQQEAFVAKWESTIWKRQSVYPDLPSDIPPCPLEVEGDISAESNLFLLVGLPGAGKSWLSRALMVRNMRAWTYISQDETGSRSVCENQISRVPVGQVLLDRCNSAASERRQWMDLASNWVRHPVCVWLDYPKDLCLFRAQSRLGHPTLRPGNRVITAVEQMDKLFVRPTLKEGFKTIYIVRSFAAAEELVSRLSPSVKLLKYPRTPHLIDLGAVGGDDIIDNMPVLQSSDHVVITEKVDGANMGFSLSHDRSQIITQNRSHYVFSSSHEQFKKLDLWIEQHHGDLFKVLGRDPHFPQRYILYGEWLYATHSIAYSELPDRFLAFDIYDRATNTFADKKTLVGLLTRTSISMTPVLHEGPMLTASELTEMVQRKSQFYKGRMEGVYVQIERNGIIVSRGKVVRGDFLAGNEHWSKATLAVNGLASEHG